jgi:hypothetical protein
MKKYSGLTITILALSLAGCYASQNFNNQVQVSRTGQYQVDVDTDVINGTLLYAQATSKERNRELTANDMKKIFADCEKEFNQTIAQDAKDGKHILSSKYLGECRGHLTLKYTGNIIKEQEFKASIGSSRSGFEIPVAMKYDTKNKQIVINGKTQGDKKAIKAFSSFQYNGKLSVKTDGKVILTNADSKPYWGLIGSYKWAVKDLTTPNASMVIATSGI